MFLHLKPVLQRNKQTKNMATIPSNQNNDNCEHSYNAKATEYYFRTNYLAEPII